MTTALDARIETEPPLSTVPIYSLAEVARYLNAPLFSLHRTASGDRWKPGPLPLHRTPDHLPQFSFAEFAALYVEAASFHLLRDWSSPTDDEGKELSIREWEGFTTEVARQWERHLHGGVPGLYSQRAVHAVANPYSMLTPAREQLLAELRAMTFERIESDQDCGTPLRLYPFTRDPSREAPRVVVMDPEVRFGRPALVGNGIPTEILGERFRAGDSVAELAEDYDLPSGDIEEALRFESRLPYQTPLV
jgi:uncharacterized protein (DUF433 family)